MKEKIFQTLLMLLLLSCQQTANDNYSALQNDANKLAEVLCQIEILQDKVFDTEGDEKANAENELNKVKKEGIALFHSLIEKYHENENEFINTFKTASKKCKYPLSDLSKEALLISEFGEQPSLCVDSDKRIHITFGTENLIYYCYSNDYGSSFSTPEKVEEVEELKLGRGMGPQITATKDFIIITAINGKGNILIWHKKHSSEKWHKKQINDFEYVAEEGLLSIGADSSSNTALIVWIDTRENDKAKIYAAFSSDNLLNWTEKLIYESPGGSVCPCCKPNVLVQNEKIYIMFRNNIDGYRDLHLIKSYNSGSTFENAQKLGMGSWKINACPMDGGGMAFNSDKIMTVWKRKNEIYLSEQHSPEIKIGEGWQPSIFFINNTPALIWQNNGNLILKKADQNEIIIGQGGFAKSVNISSKQAFIVWENNKGIVGQKIFSADLEF